MKKILAFGASNSTKSINKQLARYAADQLTDFEITFIDLNDFDIPIYSIDRENDTGFPPHAVHFDQLVRTSDGILISFAEHNGNFSTAFKNIFDWKSRLGSSTWEGRKMFLLSTSPGQRGGAGVMEIALKTLPYNGGDIVAHFSLPSFYDNFSAVEGIKNEELKAAFTEQLNLFKGSFGE